MRHKRVHAFIFVQKLIVASIGTKWFLIISSTLIEKNNNEGGNFEIKNNSTVLWVY